MTVEAPFLIAAAQAAPVFLDRAATVSKACDLIVRAGAAGARLVVFPEAFVPAYPVWCWFVPAGETMVLRELYAELVESSVELGDDSTRRLREAAGDAGIGVAIGINERNIEASRATLYNSLLYIGPDGALLGCHRKLVPTAGERMIWAQGDGATLGVHEMPFARIGGLICWENYMPLARFAMYAWGTQIYVAPTWDRGEPWLSTLRHIAKEGRVYVVSCCSAMRKSDVPDRYAFKGRFMTAVGEWINPGDSAIADPDGKFIAGPVREKEELLLAEVDPRAMIGPKWQLDVAGHYGRPDVFELIVHREPRPMVRS